MKVLLVSDLHYRLRQLDWLLHRAAAVDAVMIAGDLLDVRSQVALDVQAVAVRAALRELAGETTLFVASGNHDLDGRDEAGEGGALDGAVRRRVPGGGREPPAAALDLGPPRAARRLTPGLGRAPRVG